MTWPDLTGSVSGPECLAQTIWLEQYRPAGLAETGTAWLIWTGPDWHSRSAGSDCIKQAKAETQWYKSVRAWRAIDEVGHIWVTPDNLIKMEERFNVSKNFPRNPIWAVHIYLLNMKMKLQQKTIGFCNKTRRFAKHGPLRAKKCSLQHIVLLNKFFGHRPQRERNVVRDHIFFAQKSGIGRDFDTKSDGFLTSVVFFWSHLL